MDQDHGVPERRWGVGTASGIGTGVRILNREQGYLRAGRGGNGAVGCQESS